MFRKEEKKAIIKMILFFFFLDLEYLGQRKEGIIEALWLLGSAIIAFVLHPFWGFIALIPLLIKRQKRLFKYINEYEIAPGVGES